MRPAEDQFTTGARAGQGCPCATIPRPARVPSLRCAPCLSPCGSGISYERLSEAQLTLETIYSSRDDFALLEGARRDGSLSDPLVRRQAERLYLTYLGRQLRQFLCDGAPAGNAGARVAARILAAASQFGRDVPLTRREIAEMAGTTVETAIRETRAFEKRGWIRLARGHIRVVDPDALSIRAGGLAHRRSTKRGPRPRLQVRHRMRAWRASEERSHAAREPRGSI